MHAAIRHVGAGRHALPASVVGRELSGRSIGAGPSVRFPITARSMVTAVTAAAAAADVPTMTWRRVVFGVGRRFAGHAGHLLGETPVQVGQEFLTRGGLGVRALSRLLAARSPCGSARPQSRRAQTVLAGGPAAGRRRSGVTLARSWLAPIVDLCRQSQSAMLEHFGIGNADSEFRGRLLDRITLQETQFQNLAIAVRQLVENLSDALRGGADRLLAIGWLLNVVDRGYLPTQGLAPVRGQHGSRGGAQVCAHLARRSPSGAAAAAPRGTPRR